MKKLKRILIMAFIFAFALSQFESIHAESVEADMTDAKNAETVLADKEELDAQADTELADRENAGAVLAGAQDVQEPQVAGCKTHAEAVEELTDAMDKKMKDLDEKNDDYTLRINKVEEPKDYQDQTGDPQKHKSHYQLSFTIINKEKSFSDLKLTKLAGLINDLYKEGKIDRIKFTLGKDEGKNLEDELANIDNDEDRKAKINSLIIESLEKTMNIGRGTKLQYVKDRDGGVRLSKKACGDKEAFLWLRIPFRNAIVNEIKDKIEGKDITVNKNADVNWRDGVKVKDSVVDKVGYQKHIDNAKVEDISGRDTKTAGVKNGNVKLVFTDYTELTINQNLIVKRDHLDDELDRRQAEQRRQEEERENDRKRNTRRERLKRQEKEDKEAKLEEKTVAKKEMKAKKDYGIVNATALKLVTQQDIPQGQSGEAITEMLRRGVLNGVSSAKFAPKLTVSRAMLAQVLMNISTDKTVGMIELKDLKEGEWYADAITWAVTHGVFKGYPDGSFKAEQKLTRVEVASVLYSFLKERGIDMPEIQDFKYEGKDIPAWSKEAVTKLAKLGLVNGKTSENYEARGEFTREELAVALYKIINWVMSQSI